MSEGLVVVVEGRGIGVKEGKGGAWSGVVE